MEMKNTARVSYRSLYARVMKLGLPILVSQLGMIVVGFADNSMVGHYSTPAIASASFVNNVFNIPLLMCLGFTYGLTPLIGAMFTRRADGEIGSTVRAGLVINVIFGLLLTGAMTVLYFNLDRLGQPEHLLPVMRPYFLLYLAGILPISIFQVFAQCAYAVNRTRMPMWVILAANGVNVFGNWLLIYGNLGCPEMGLTGAGISTLISRWLCAGVIFVIFMRSRHYRAFLPSFLKKVSRPGLVKKIVKTSYPVSLQMGMETGCFSLSAIMAGWIGAAELASFQIIVIIGSLGFCVYYAVATAISVMVANAAGHDDRALMRRAAWAGYHVILVLAAAASLVFWFGFSPMVHIFTSDQTVINVAKTLIFPLVLYQLADATQIAFSNALRGTSNVMPMMLTAFLAYMVVGIPSTYLICFTLGMGLYGIVLSFSLSLVVAAVMYLAFFLRSTRR